MCGGCVWQEIPYARQLEFKRAHILESLGRLGRIDGVSGPGGGQDLEAITGSVLPSPEERHFRGKVELVFGQAQGPRVSSPQGHQGRPIPPLLGFRRLGSHEVVDIAANINVNVNGRYPYYIIVQYVDPHGVRHIFKSPSLRIFRDPELLGKKVKVYVENDNFKHYYVDVDEILPKYVEH